MKFKYKVYNVVYDLEDDDVTTEEELNEFPKQFTFHMEDDKKSLSKAEIIYKWEVLADYVIRNFILQDTGWDVLSFDWEIIEEDM